MNLYKVQIDDLRKWTLFALRYFEFAHARPGWLPCRWAKCECSQLKFLVKFDIDIANPRIFPSFQLLNTFHRQFDMRWHQSPVIFKPWSQWKCPCQCISRIVVLDSLTD
jgi:hypothetical protein